MVDGMAADMRLRLVLAGVLLPLLAVLFGSDSGPLDLVLLIAGGICLLAGLIGYATQRD